MQTLTRETHTSEHTGRSRRWLLPVIAALVLLVIAGGVWLIVEANQTDDQAVATELVDTWIRGWNEEDDDTIRSAFTADAEVDGYTLTQHVSAWRGRVTNVRRAGEMTSTGEEDVFTWTMEFDWSGSRWSRDWTIVLSGDLIARAVLAPDYTQVDS